MTAFQVRKHRPENQRLCYQGAGAVSITGSAFPVIAASGNLPLTYFAKVSGDAPNSTDVNAMSVVFTISIVD